MLATIVALANMVGLTQAKKGKGLVRRTILLLGTVLAASVVFR
jgi:hypothetical protein